MGKDKDEKKDDKLKKAKKKIAGGAAATGLGLSVLLGGMFESPEELTQKNPESSSLHQNAPVVMTVDLDDDDSEEENDGEENREEEQTGLFAKIKMRILQLPAAVRALVGVPLWAVGWVIIHLLSLAWEAVLVPVLGVLLKWVLAGAAMLAVFAVAMKCAFPNLPLKKILRPKNILFLLLGTAVLGVLDQLLPLFWSDYHGVRFLVMLGGGFLVLATVGIPFIIRQLKEEKRAKVLAEESEKENEVKLWKDKTLALVKKAEKAAGIETAAMLRKPKRRE